MALSQIKVKQMSFSQMIILYPMAFCHTMVKQMTFSQMMTHIMAFHHKMFHQVTYGQMIFYHLHFIVLRFIYFHVVKSCLPNNVWKNVLFQMKLHPMTFCGMTFHPTLTTIRDLILSNLYLIAASPASPFDQTLFDTTEPNQVSILLAMLVVLFEVASLSQYYGVNPL